MRSSRLWNDTTASRPSGFNIASAADKALYAAKASGRNRSVLASLPELALAARVTA